MKQLAMLLATLILATGTVASQEASGAPGMPPMPQVHPALIKVQPIMMVGTEKEQLAQENMYQDQVAVEKSEATTTGINQAVQQVGTQVAEEGNAVKQTLDSSAQTLGQMESPLMTEDS